MAYAEKRSGGLTGRWCGEVLAKAGRFKHSFPTKKEAEAYEAYVRVMGVEPPTIADGGRMASQGRSFREVAERCRAAGGPRGAWKRGRDRSTFQRLGYLVTQLGDYNIADVTRTHGASVSFLIPVGWD